MTIHTTNDEEYFSNYDNTKRQQHREIGQPQHHNLVNVQNDYRNNFYEYKKIQSQKKIDDEEQEQEQEQQQQQQVQSTSSVGLLSKSKIPIFRQHYRNTSLVDRKRTSRVNILKATNNKIISKNGLDQSGMTDELTMMMMMMMNNNKSNNLSAMNSNLAMKRALLAKSKFGRSKSMNFHKQNTNQTINLSSYSAKSTSFSDSLSDSASNLSFEISTKNFNDATKSFMACLKRIEEKYSADLLYDSLSSQFKHFSSGLLTVSSVELHLFNSSLSSSTSATNNDQRRQQRLKSPATMMRSTPVERTSFESGTTPPIGFIYDLTSGRNLVQENKSDANTGSRFDLIREWLKTLKKFRKLYVILQRDIINELISLEMETLPNEFVLSRSIGFRPVDSQTNHEDLLKR